MRSHSFIRRFAALFFAFVILTGVTAFTPAFAEEGETETPVSVAVVNAASLHLRSEPSTSASSLGLARRGASVVVYSTEGNWCKVDWNGLSGYMYLEYLDISGENGTSIGQGIITGSVVNLRSEPSTSSSVIKKLSRNVMVDVLGVSEGWYKVDYNGSAGYIHPDYLEIRGDSAASRSDSSSSGSSLGSDIVAYAKQYLGVRYKYGGTSPSGFDCSGLTYYVYKHFGYSINRGASGQLSNGISVSKENLQLGDLVFFKQAGSKTAASHVGIYVGGGSFIHATSPGDVVSITSLSNSYYAKYYIGARRII